MRDAEPIGDWVIDGVRPAPPDPPLTTIAWRVVHMTLGPWNWINNLEGAFQVVSDGRSVFEVNDRVDLSEPELRADAMSAVVLWDEVVLRFTAVTESFDDEGLTTAVTFPWGRTFSPCWIVSHVVRELLHHSAEVGCLRDIFRHTMGADGAGATLLSPGELEERPER